ncbi:MAG: SpaA isopeptide-forming pilin-related protein, partial [Faecousia sp.]
ISIPMVNTATSSNNENAQWIYDVSVYPKNHESTGTLELTKVDQNGSPLEDVVFELYKKEFDKDGNLPTGDWEAVTTTIANNGTSTDLVLKTGADGKITLANLPANLHGTQYKLVEVSAPNGYIVNQTPLYFKVNTDNTITWNTETTGDCANLNKDVIDHQDAKTEDHSGTLLEIKIRNEQLSLTKEVKENGGATWKTDEQYRLDDEITFRLTAYVPNNITEISYEIKDIPSVGITDSANSGDYTVTYGNTADTCTDALDSDKYTWSKIDASGSNGQGFKLTLTDSGKTATAGKFIQIEYKAHMNANAVIAGTGNGNKATLTYSKYIGGGEGTYAITDEARVYTYQYQITKHKDSATGDVVGGVAFKLLDATNPENILKVVKLEDGKYRLAIATDADTVKTDTLVTKTDGTILIQGLENGTYYLKETKTIPGYNLLSEPFEITLNVAETTTWNEDGAFGTDRQVVKTYGSTAYGVDNAMGTSTIINKKGFVLPQTGGMGYLLFCTVGIVLIAGGAMLIFGGRKKKIR